jgi:hypothetical protein
MPAANSLTGGVSIGRYHFHLGNLQHDRLRRTSVGDLDQRLEMIGGSAAPCPTGKPRTTAGPAAAKTSHPLWMRPRAEI